MAALTIAIVQVGEANYNKKTLTPHGREIIVELANHFHEFRCFAGIATRIVHCSNSPTCMETAGIIAQKLDLKADANALLNSNTRDAGRKVARSLIDDILGIDYRAGILVGQGDFPLGITSGLLEAKGKRPVYEPMRPGEAYLIYRSTGEYHKITASTEEV